MYVSKSANPFSHFDLLQRHVLSLVCLQLGRDPRLSGPELLAALAAGINSRGAAAADFGLATTPAMFMSCILPGAHVICMVVVRTLE